MLLFQFCEFLSAPEVSRWAGPIIDVLLDYVGNVQLCSRLKEHIDSYEDWAGIKEKAGRAVAAATSISSALQRPRPQAVVTHTSAGCAPPCYAVFSKCVAPPPGMVAMGPQRDHVIWGKVAQLCGCRLDITQV